MKTETLNRVHPCLKLDVLAKYKALFEGGETFRELHHMLAPKLPGESEEHYAFRRGRLRYRGYVGPIILFFVELLFQAPYTVRLRRGDTEILDDPLLMRLKQDADGKGCELGSIAQSAFLQMSRDGWSWLHLEREESGEETKVIVEAECAAEVINWQIIDGRILWIVEREKTLEMRSPYQEKAQCITRWTVYDEVNKTKWEAAHWDGEDEPKEAQQVSVEPHGFLQVPFAALTPMHGLFLMGQLADAQMDVFNLSNAHTFGLNVAAYPTAVFKRLKDGHKPTISPGGLTEIHAGEDLDWIAPPAAPFEALAKREKECRDEMYRIAHQFAHGVDNSAAAIGRSGESKAADNEAMIAALRGFGRLMCEALESALQIAIDATRDDGAIVSVEGLKDFDPAAIERALAKLKNAMDAGIDSPSLLAEMRKDIARSLLHGADQALVQIVEKEIESAKTKPDTIRPPAPRLPFSE